MLHFALKVLIVLFLLGTVNRAMPAVERAVDGRAVRDLRAAVNGERVRCAGECSYYVSGEEGCRRKRCTHCANERCLRHEPNQLDFPQLLLLARDSLVQSGRRQLAPRKPKPR